MLEWGKRVVDGEQKRISMGGIPIYNPTVAKVKVHYGIFVESHERQKALQTLTNRSLDELTSLRDRADELILNIWNSVETKYQHLATTEERLAKCREYGLIYYYRTGERQPQLF